MPNIRGCEQCELIAFLTNSRFPLESTSTDVLCSEQTLVNQGIGVQTSAGERKKKKDACTALVAVEKSYHSTL